MQFKVIKCTKKFAIFSHFRFEESSAFVDGTSSLFGPNG